MRHRLVVLVIVCMAALGLSAGPAWAQAGQAQTVEQGAVTLQGASSNANANQNAVNANVPVVIAGGGVSAGSSSANQNGYNNAYAGSSNSSATLQAAHVTQTGGGSSCHAGCGGSGQYQAVGQVAATGQEASAEANADQNAVNANVPVTIAGGDVSGGSSSATQNADNDADANAENESATTQLVSAEQTAGGSSCKKGCGGNGQYQAIGQAALTHQAANADANADQNAVNGNAPVAIAGGDVTTGDSTADQNTENDADAYAGNASLTIQAVEATQTGASGCKDKCGDPCKWGCGGDGQWQEINQAALTVQDAEADAYAGQNAVNGNAPVAIAGGDIDTGSSSAYQNAENDADANAENESATIQLVSAEQTAGGSSCHAGCGGNGQYQAVGQLAATFQGAASYAGADQNAVNGNAAVAIAGGDVTTGDSTADQNAENDADAYAGNASLTAQAVEATQTGASGCKDKCGDPCKWGCGGDGQHQEIGQAALTVQDAYADAYADQNAVNGNAPVAIAGGDIDTGSSSAYQNAENDADANAGNESATAQLVSADQTGGGGGSCYSGCGGNGQSQTVLQLAATFQSSEAIADAYQNAVNGNAPVAIAGGDVTAGDSTADQNAENDADAYAGNASLTLQAVEATQTGSGCHDRCGDPCKWGCGGDGQHQEIAQAALTHQVAFADAIADQNAVNGNAPVAIAGGDVDTGSSSAYQNAENDADANAENESATEQLVLAEQVGSSCNDRCDPCRRHCPDPCKSGCGGSGQKQKILQLSLTKQEAFSFAGAYQNAVNGNAPVAIAGGDVTAGDSTADQNAENDAESDSSNASLTAQLVLALQEL